MGPPVLTGAFTTVISAAVLSLCQIQIFAKFGLILAVNLGLAVILASNLFIVLLFIFGPTNDTGSFKQFFGVFIRFFYWIKKKRAVRNVEDQYGLNELN